MEYSELIEALQKEDDVRVNKILNHMIPRLIRFLEIRLGAEKKDAEDCVQYSLECALDVLRNDNLKDPDRVLSYLMSTCRNNYLKIREKKREVNYDRIPSTHFHNPNQLELLLENERQEILNQCLEELSDMYRNFIEYWLMHPEASADTAAVRFNISVSNAWTRKHRVIQQLNECYKKKSNK